MGDGQNEKLERGTFLPFPQWAEGGGADVMGRGV